MANVYITEEMYEAICFAFGQVSSDTEGSDNEEYMQNANKCAREEPEFIYKYKKSYYAKIARQALNATGREYTKDDFAKVKKQLEKDDFFMQKYEKINT